MSQKNEHLQPTLQSRLAHPLTSSAEAEKQSEGHRKAAADFQKNESYQEMLQDRLAHPLTSSAEAEKQRTAARNAAQNTTTAAVLNNPSSATGPKKTAS